MQIRVSFSCQRVLQNAQQNQTPILVPVYVSLSDVAGNLTYVLQGFADFVVTGYHMPGFDAPGLAESGKRLPGRRLLPQRLLHPGAHPDNWQPGRHQPGRFRDQADRLRQANRTAEKPRREEEP